MAGSLLTSQSGQSTMLVDIFKRIDPQTCEALISPTPQQTFKLIMAKLRNMSWNGEANQSQLFDIEEKYKIQMLDK